MAHRPDRPDRPDPRCYDCGSTIPGHHTPACEMANPGDARDLPQIPGTQWWDRSESQRDHEI